MLQNQRVRRQSVDNPDLDNTDFDDHVELPDFTMETTVIENEDELFREEAQETGGAELDVTFTNAMELWMDTLRNDSWVKQMNNNLRILGRQALYQQSVISELDKKILLPDPAVETTTQKYLPVPDINKKVNLLLNTLKQLKTKYNIDFETRIPVGDSYLYVSDSRINEEINHILIQLNMIKMSHGLSAPYKDFFEKELNFFSRNLKPFEMPKPEKLQQQPFSFAQLQTASISAAMVLFVFLPFYIYFNCK